MENKSKIKKDKLFKSFTVGSETIEVLKDINIDIKVGDFTIIFGPSGCGKSTMLHTLIGLEQPSVGKIYVENQDFYSITEDERAMYRRHRIGMIYQQPLWIGALDIFNNLVFSLHLLNYNRQVMEQKAKTVLGIVKMEDKIHYRPLELSSGQQQKISLARALIIDPSIIVADEPTGNLDTNSGVELLETLLEVNKKGITIIMVTHDLEYLRYANRIFHMIDGRVVEDYRPKRRFKQTIAGKRGVEGGNSSDVRDPQFLKKLNI